MRKDQEIVEEAGGRAGVFTSSALGQIPILWVVRKDCLHMGLRTIIRIKGQADEVGMITGMTSKNMLGIHVFDGIRHEEMLKTNNGNRLAMKVDEAQLSERFLGLTEGDGGQLDASAKPTAPFHHMEYEAFTRDRQHDTSVRMLKAVVISEIQSMPTNMHSRKKKILVYTEYVTRYFTACGYCIPAKKSVFLR